MRRARASFITLLAAGLASGCGSHESCLEVSDTPIGCGGAEVERIASFPDRGGGRVHLAIEALELDDTHVYFPTDNEEIVRASRETFDTELLVELGDCGVGGITLDAQWVYYTRVCRSTAQSSTAAESSLERVPKQGGSPEVIFEMSGDASHPIVHDGELYFRLRVHTQDLTFIRRIDPSAPPARDEPFTPVATASGYIVFTVHDGSVLWSSGEGPEIWATPEDGGPDDADEIGAVSDGAVRRLMVDGDCAYVLVDLGDAARLLRHCPDGSLEDFLPPPADRRLAVRDGFVFGVGVHEGDMLLSEWAPPSLSRETLVGALDFPRSLAADDTHVYWIQGFESTDVYRVRRPRR